MTATAIGKAVLVPNFLAGQLNADGEASIARGFLGNHTYSCALPVRGGVCDCQSDHDPSTNPWPSLSTGVTRRSWVAQRRSSRAA